MENPHTPIDDGNMVVIQTFEDEIQEALAIGALNEAGIKYVIRSFEDHAYDGLFTLSRGHSQALVLEDESVKAKEIVNAALSSSKP